jgi:protein-L-isoaspartate(D-aspartate) O-methyltransferase
MAVHLLPLHGIENPRVLSVMKKVDRARFVPADVRRFAYDDRALPIGFDQTISQPYVVGLMSELLCLHGDERVLEIGTGSGYQAAILGELAKEVDTIEIVPELARRSARLLEELGYHNVHVREGNGAMGWPEKAPFDAVIVTCAPDDVPQPLIGQLKENGRLVIPIGAGSHEQMLCQFEKVSGDMVRRPIIPVSFVPMTEEVK